jgi:alpha-D-ribose 1-methylphosphonate 5-triphosphate synthase subunit PhnH
MISVQRRYRRILDQPADPATLQRWIEQAAALAPLNPAVQRELAR